ncbi:LuxR C-terminal-related transcriptional regulator, partial [Bacillus licheniformis]
AGTVRNYISEIMHKLDAKNRTEAAKVAEGEGWI